MSTSLDIHLKETVTLICKETYTRMCAPEEIKLKPPKLSSDKKTDNCGIFTK